MRDEDYSRTDVDTGQELDLINPNNNDSDDFLICNLWNGEKTEEMVTLIHIINKFFYE